MSEIQYYVLDTETTGLSPALHEINEYSIIRCKDKTNLFKKVKCERPESASLDALRITRKTIEDLKEGLSKKEACERLVKFFEEDNTNPNSRCIVGHNIAFDRKFLFALFDECDMEFPANLWMDTMSMTKQLYKKAGLTKKSAKLADSCDFMKINKINDAHQSKVDSRNTYFLWKALMATDIDYIKFIKTQKHRAEEENKYDFDISDTE